MRKKIITRIGLGLLLFLLILAAVYVGFFRVKETKKEVAEEPGTVHLLNGFEQTADLYAFKPKVSSTVATMSINTEDELYVKEGSGSLKYEYVQGNRPEMLLFVEKCSYPQLDISNLYQIGVSVYSEYEQQVEATLAVVVKGNTSLLTENFTLEANQWNDLEFRLSALACKYNEDKIVGFSLRLDAEESATFYIDNWTATMGAENTDDDNKYESIIKEIVKRINALPKTIALSDGEELENLYMKYASLPEVYRNIIPNYDVLVEAIEGYVDVKYASEEDGLERKFLAFDEFYGIGMIRNDVDSNYPILYQQDVAYKDEEGSIMITFDGSTSVCYFAYSTPLYASRYDYVEISFYNEDPDPNHRKVVSFNWQQVLYIQPNSWGTIRIPGDEFRSEGRFIIGTIDENGIWQDSCGKVYISTMYASRNDLLEELKALPNASDFQMPRDIKYLTMVEHAKKLYDALADKEKAQIPEKLVKNLEACYEKIDGYKTIFNVNTEDIQLGTYDCIAKGEGARGTDDQYGPVYLMNFTGEADGDYVAGFQINKKFVDHKSVFFYIYNPQSTTQTMILCADGSWTRLGTLALKPGWNKIELSSDKEVSNYLFGLFEKGSDVVGEWKITNFYEMSYKALVEQLIDGLPDPSTIEMPGSLKYIAAIDEAKQAYDAMIESGEGQISAAKKAKLEACLAKIAGYSAAVNAKTDEMQLGMLGNPCEGTLSRETDSEYGPIFELNIKSANFSNGLAGCFLVEKDLSASKNMFFYIYNPQSSPQTIYLFADEDWKVLATPKLEPGWNKVTLDSSIQVQKFIFGLFPEGSDVVGTWKITSIYALSDAVAARMDAAETEAMIDALPAANTIVMPDDLKYVASIEAAKAAYDALSAEGRNSISAERKQKLNACLAKIDGYTAAVNAKTDVMQLGMFGYTTNGTITKATDSEYGPVFALNITGAEFSGGLAGGFVVEKNLSGNKNMFFYIYNPTGSTQTINVFNENWKVLASWVTLSPGWNKVELSSDYTVGKCIFGMFPEGSTVVGNWKITSIYALSDSIIAKQDAAETEAMIDALPVADTIVMPDDLKYVASIEAAKASYDALTAESQNSISAERKQKLDACLAKIAGYTAVVNAKTDEMQVGMHGYTTSGTMARATDSEYGPVFALEITGAEFAGGLAGFFVVEKNLSDNNNMFFYVYNPTDATQSMHIFNENWKALASYVALEPGWNKVELSSDYVIGSCVFGMFPEGSDVVGTWKITSIYALSDSIIAKQDAAETEAMIDALPVADTIVMPKDLKYVSLIEETKAAYDALPEEVKNVVSAERKQKLEALLDKIDGYTTAVNAKTDEMQLGMYGYTTNGTVTKETDDEYGPVFALEITGAEFTEGLAGCFVVDKNLSDNRNMFFYIYNPTDATQYMHVFNENWEALASWVALKPGWNKVELSSEYVIGSCVFGMFPEGSNVVGTWRITSFYDVSLSAYATVVSAELDAMQMGLYGSGCIGNLTKETDEEYGPVFALDITGPSLTTADTGFFTLEKDLSVFKNIFFHIFNPTQSAVCMNVYSLNSDGNTWDPLAPWVLVNPGWNRVALSSDYTIETCLFGTFSAEGYDVKGKWKISSFYSEP